MQVRKSILIIIIIAICLSSYFNTLFAHFVWDDNIFIIGNPYMHSFKFLPQFFLQEFWKVGIETTNIGYYRPLLAVSCMLDYTIWRDKPFGYHLTNLIFHILVSILVFLFVQMLSKNRLISFSSALLFSVHPIHTESVSFISGRVDVLPLAFLLLSLILFLKYVSNNKLILYLLSLFCFFISLLFKEMAVTLPLIVLVMDYLFVSKRKIKDVMKNFPRFHLGFFAVFGLYFLIRIYTIDWSSVIANMRYCSNFLPGKSHYWRLFTAIKILTFYVRLLFFPYALKTDYFFSPANSLSELVVFLGAILLLLLVVIAIKNVKHSPILSFSILWFFITVLPVSNIFPMGNIFAERYMYIPSVGFSIAMGFLFSWLLKQDIRTEHLNWKQSMTLLFFLLIVALGRVTFERNKVWNNEFSLWYETVKAVPNGPRARLNLASAYYNLNFLDKAIEQAQIALKLYPNYYEAFDTLGHIYYKKGLVDEAIKMYKIAIGIYPDRANAYRALAVVYGSKGQYKEAIEAGLTALKHNPYLDGSRYNLALNYSNAGLIDEAIKTYEEYLKNHSDCPEVHVDIGQLYYKKGDYQKAKEHWLRALKIDKSYKPAKDALELLTN